ncbi:MAG: arginine repressor [Ruminococcaceae bacterium]|nr:arginine repressor [Oscillospiraceae bacterium]
MKLKRQEAILDIISKYSVETQEELIERLYDEGYEVTQATVSRDIRELKLTKVSSGRGGYRYMLPPQTEARGSMKFTSTILDSVIMVDYALNTVVIKTVPSLANPVAASIDSMHSPEILGCVAGDDTIIVVTRDIDAAKEITDKLKAMIKG